MILSLKNCNYIGNIPLASKTSESAENSLMFVQIIWGCLTTV